MIVFSYACLAGELPLFHHVLLVSVINVGALILCYSFNSIQFCFNVQAVIAHACHGHTLQLCLEVSEREEDVVALHLPNSIGLLKKTLWVGTGTEMRTQYLPAY